MGGNAKYRYHTGVIRNTGNASGVQEMRDSNGNLIRIPEGKNVGRDNRSGANRQNAKERMLNAKAIQEVRDAVKEVRKSYGTTFGMSSDKFGNSIRKLGDIANQIQPKSVSDLTMDYPELVTTDEIENIEKVLGVTLK